MDIDMKQCQECGCNEARIHLTHILKNEMSHVHLCEECAKKRGIYVETQIGDMALDLQAGLQHFDQRSIGQETGEDPIGESVMDENAQEENEEPVITCNACSMNSIEFKQKGLVGCSECYTTFRKQIDQMLVQIYDTVSYKGKNIKTTNEIAIFNSYSIDDLKMQLSQAVSNEQFEQAAILRDRINFLLTQQS